MNDMAKVAWAKVVRDGEGQMVRLPDDFRLDGDEVAIRREGDQLILDPKQDRWAWLDRLEPFDDDMVAAILDRPGPYHPETLLDDDVKFD